MPISAMRTSTGGITRNLLYLGDVIDFSLHGITVHLDRPDPLISHGLSGSSWKS